MGLTGSFEEQDVPGEGRDWSWMSCLQRQLPPSPCTRFDLTQRLQYSRVSGFAALSESSIHGVNK